MSKRRWVKERNPSQLNKRWVSFVNPSYDFYDFYPKVDFFDDGGHFELNTDPFEKILNTIHSSSDSDLEFATTAYLFRMFKRDILGLAVDGHELVNDHSYKVLYSDRFNRRLTEDYPTLTKSDLNVADLNAQKQFNDMFRHYLKFGNFLGYVVLPLVHQTLVGA